MSNRNNIFLNGYFFIILICIMMSTDVGGKIDSCNAFYFAFIVKSFLII